MTVPKTCLDHMDLYHESQKLRNGEVYEVQADVTLADLGAFIDFACGNGDVLSEANAPSLKKLADEFKFRRLTQAFGEMCPPKSESDFDVLFAKISKVESKQCDSDRIIRALKEEIQHLRHIILGTSKKLEAGRHVQLALERINNTIECVPELDMRTRSIDLRLREMEDYFVDQHQNLRNELRAKHQQLAVKMEQAIVNYRYNADRTLESMLSQLKRDNDEDRKALESRVGEAITRQLQPVTNLLMEQGGMCRKALSGVDQLRLRVDRLEPCVDRLRLRVDRLEPCVDKLELHVDRLDLRVYLLEPRVDKLEPRVDRLEPRVDSVQNRLNVMAHSLAMGLPRELSAVVITDCRNTGIIQHLLPKLKASTNAGNAYMLADIFNWRTDNAYWSQNICEPCLTLSFQDAKVVLTRYDLKTYYPGRGDRGRHLKSWTVFANCDGRWISISNWRKSKFLNGPGKSEGFRVRGHKPSSEIELKMTDVNHAGTWELVLSGIKLYGWVFE